MPWVVLQARISLSETIYVYSKGNNHCVMVLQRLTASILPWHWITTTSSSLQAFVCTSSPQPVVRTWRKAMTYSSMKLSVVLPRVDVGVGQSKCFPQKLNPPSFNPGGNTTSDHCRQNTAVIESHMLFMSLWLYTMVSCNTQCMVLPRIFYHISLCISLCLLHDMNTKQLTTCSI